MIDEISFINHFLFHENIITKSHSGTFSKFGELFVKTNLISAQYSSNFRKAFEYRQSVDYDIEAQITEE